MVLHLMFDEFLYEKKVFSHPLQLSVHLFRHATAQNLYYMNSLMWQLFAQTSPTFQAKDFHLLQMMSSIGEGFHFDLFHFNSSSLFE